MLLEAAYDEGMRHVRTLLVTTTTFALAFATVAQDAVESRPATKPATDTAPASRPAEARARHPRIGVRCDAAMLDHKKIARVEAVLPGSPAERAGIKVGDVIVKVAGEEIRDDKTYREALAKRRAGDTVTIVVSRGGAEMDLAVTLVETLSRTEPDAVTVQHILVKCGERSSPKRTTEEAKKLADDIMPGAKNGANFASLVRSHSEDPGSLGNDPAGSYVLANDGKPKPVPTAIERGSFVAGFTAVAFALEVGDIAMVPFDAELSPHGFHILHRVK
jgi:membrane-associated protease RseP (regulator of RpoE activity)